MKSPIEFIGEHMMNRTKLTMSLSLIPVLLTTAVTTGFSQQALSVNSAKVTVPERTEVRVELEEELRSGATKQGHEVEFKVVNDVYGPSHVLLITSGTPAYGTVTKSSRRGMFGKSGSLEFTCDYVLLPDGGHIPLRSESLGSSGRNNGGAVIATVLFASVLGVFINGRDVDVPKGKEFPMYVDQTTTISSPLTVNSIPNAAVAPVQNKSLFSMKDGTQIVGSLAAFDGSVYSVNTDQGIVSLKAADVRSVYAIATPAAITTPVAAPVTTVVPAPVTIASVATVAPAVSAPTPVAAPAPAVVAPVSAVSVVPAPVAAPAPAAQDPPVIKAIPSRVRIETRDGNSFIGTIIKLDGDTYTMKTSFGDVPLKSSNILSVEYLDEEKP